MNRYKVLFIMAALLTGAMFSRVASATHKNIFPLIMPVSQELLLCDTAEQMKKVILAVNRGETPMEAIDRVNKGSKQDLNCAVVYTTYIPYEVVEVITENDSTQIILKVFSTDYGIQYAMSDIPVVSLEEYLEHLKKGASI